ncbi:hypothetical protein RZS08_17905, partial [Arthrospira platensis SPKY1]|nr:hypothetical protein [Arthrospira platensis SPKY1]
MLHQECQRLTDWVGKPLRVHRSHYLRTRPALWAELEALGFWVDASLGWPARTGLRNGLNHPWRYWDLDSQKALKLWACPLHFMDVPVQAQQTDLQEKLEQSL